MINAEQLRAARALLDWKTSDLAKLSGITVNGINKIERGYVQGRRDTLEALQSTLEKAGVEFLPNSGVRKKEQIVTTYTGEECLKNLLIDVYETLRGTSGEMLVAHLDEGDALKSLHPDFLKEQIRKRKEAGIGCRLLVRADDPNLIPPYDTYRAIPKESFSPYPFYIYGRKLALVSWEPSPRIIIIDDERFSESARKLFNIAWESGKKIANKDH
jgi:transcriptional regulator with XRE-family HTH domain